MTKPEIPPAALEAGGKASYEDWRRQCDIVSETLEWDDLAESEREQHRQGAAAAFQAIIAAWPGMLTERRARCDAVVLPFNIDADLRLTEKTDD